MTDHKAEWVRDVVRCLEDVAEQMRATGHGDERFMRLIQRAPAAPAASEGEDGRELEREVRYWLENLPNAVRCHPGGGAESLAQSFAVNAAVHTRPAAQVAATPKHDEGREWIVGFTGWTKADGKTLWMEHDGEPVFRIGKHPDIGTNRAIYSEAKLGCVATQPAARRVTKEDVDRARVAYLGVGFHRSLNECLRAALESFAQPAEGVSRSDRDFPGDAEHENGDYENRCVQCGEVFTGYKRRVVCRVCAEKRGDTP